MKSIYKFAIIGITPIEVSNPRTTHKALCRILVRREMFPNRESYEYAIQRIYKILSKYENVTCLDQKDSSKRISFFIKNAVSCSKNDTYVKQQGLLISWHSVRLKAALLFAKIVDQCQEISRITQSVYADEQYKENILWTYSEAYSHIMNDIKKENKEKLLSQSNINGICRYTPTEIIDNNGYCALSQQAASFNNDKLRNKYSATYHSSNYDIIFEGDSQREVCDKVYAWICEQPWISRLMFEAPGDLRPFEISIDEYKRDFS